MPASTFPAPLGVACQVQSQLLDSEAKIARQVYSVEKKEAAIAAQSTDEWKALNSQELELRSQCSEREVSDLATMAQKLRELRGRFFPERARIKDRMIQWQQACIKQHFYPGEGDAAIAQVYGGNLDINDANVNNLFFPFDDVTDFLARSNWGPTPANSLHSDPRYYLPGMAPRICESFNHDPTPDPPDLGELYPDLVSGTLYTLEVMENAPIIQENLASGASLGQRP